jgi:hypothetical protein
MKTYKELKQEHSKNINEFEGLFWAFNESQMNQALEKYNASKKDIYSIGCGGFLLRSKLSDFKKMLKKHNAELKQMRENESGLINALVYELQNHEYGYTYDPTSAIEALGMNVENFPKDILNKACKIALESEGL